MTENTSIYLVDGSSIAFRSYFAMIKSQLRRSDGFPTAALTVFFNSIFQLVESRNPHCMVVSFDLAEPTFRKQEYADYKAGREEMPDDLRVQWPIMKEGIRKLGIPIFEVPGFEADDVIGTIAKAAENKGMKTAIFSGDKDVFQLLDNSIEILMPQANDGVKQYGRAEVFEKLGVWPEQVIDYKALVGDASDNIKGVRGIGPKTAAQLLGEYKTLDGIYENIDKIKSASVKTKLGEGREDAYMSQKLATIRLDVPVEFTFDQCQLKLPPVDEVFGFFREYELSSIVKRLPRILKVFNNGVDPEIDPQFLTATPKIGSRAGKMGGAAVATVEPVTETRRGGGVAVAQQKLDLVMPAKQIKVGTISAPEPGVVRTPDRLRELVATLSQQQVIGLEVLRDSHESCEGCIAGFAFAWDSGAKLTDTMRPDISLKDNNIETAYIPIRHKTDGEQLSASEVEAALKPILENPAIGKVSYNAKSEINALALAGINYSPVVFDPMLASYVVNPDQSHKLKDQAQRILGYSIPAVTDLIGTGKKQVTWDYLPVGSASQYASDAARISYLLAGWYTLQMDPDQQELMWDIDLPLSAVLANLEQNGVKVDVDYLSSYGSELAAQLKRLETEIYELAGHPFNIGSPLQLQKVLFQELKLQPKGKTMSGSGYSTDRAVLEALSEDHAIVAKILEHRQISKLHSTYVESLPQQVSHRDGRVHGEFNQTSTATGRLSSTNPNLQNIPIKTEMGRNIRRAFVASDHDHVILSADYSQIELRLLAHMSGDEKLVQAFKDDEDVHKRTAAAIFDVPPSEVTSQQRNVGKTLNFALVYRQGAFATAQQLGITTNEAKVFIDKHFAAFPRIKSYMDSVIEEARQRSYVETLWGRRRYFANLNDGNRNVREADERAACNAPLQGSAADLIKLAMIRLDKELKARKLGAKLILQVHDELVLDVPKSELEETQSVVRESMQMDQPLKVPLRVDIGVGPNWMDAK
jgi:DNA polymerase-1